MRIGLLIGLREISLTTTLLVFGLGLGCTSRTQVDSTESRQPGGFLTPNMFSTLSPPFDMNVYDFNGDGKLDIMAPLLGANISVLQNDSVPGIVAFSNSTISSDSKQILSFAVAQFTADNIPDLFTLNRQGNLLVYEQAIDGTLTVLHSLENVDAKVFGIDYVNSTDLVYDLLIGASGSRNLSAHWFTDSNTSFITGFFSFASPWVDSMSPSDFTQMKVLDLDSAGINSVILIDAENAAIVTYVHVTGVRPMFVYEGGFDPFPSDPSLPYPDLTSWYAVSKEMTRFSHTPRRFSTGDMNSDSIQDLAVLMENPGGDHFSGAEYFPPTLAESEFPFTWVAIYETAIVRGPAGVADTFREAEYTFMGGLYFPGTTHDIAVADVNGDDIPDIIGVTEGSRGVGSYMFYYPGIGDFTFGDPLGFLMQSGGFRVNVFDVDGDLFNDVCVLAPITNSVLVYLNDGGTGLGEKGVVFPVVE